MCVQNLGEDAINDVNPDICLYYSPGACSLAVHIVLEELELPYRISSVLISEGQNYNNSFLRLNPKGRVPVLHVNESILTEAPAILVYLANMKPEAELLSLSEIDRFRCLEWLNWLSSTVHSVGFGQIWRPDRFTNDQAQFDDIIARGRENITFAYRHIENAMTGRKCSVGHGYTCVDPFLLVFYLWGKAIGFDMKGDHPAWSLHAENVLSSARWNRKACHFSETAVKNTLSTSHRTSETS